MFAKCDREYVFFSLSYLSMPDGCPDTNAFYKLPRSTNKADFCPIL